MVSVNEIKANTAFGPMMYKLPAVKECLYHPQLPTFRRMDIDTAAHKLPDEHCRTTATCSKDNFRSATVTLYRPAQKPLNCIYDEIVEPRFLSFSSSQMSQLQDLLNVTETGRFLNQEESNLKSLPFDGPLYNKSDSKLPFTGYSMRYLSPPITSSWKYTLRQEPFIDNHGQRPVPANIFSRHRNLSSSCRVSTYAWRS